MRSKITYTKKGTDFMELPFESGLIVSSQALSGNPLKDPYILARLAKAAELGGAVAIRAIRCMPKDISKHLLRITQATSV